MVTGDGVWFIGSCCTLRRGNDSCCVFDACCVNTAASICMLHGGVTLLGCRVEQ